MPVPVPFVVVLVVTAGVVVRVVTAGVVVRVVTAGVVVRVVTAGVVVRVVVVVGCGLEPPPQVATVGPGARKVSGLKPL